MIKKSYEVYQISRDIYRETHPEWRIEESLTVCFSKPEESEYCFVRIYGKDLSTSRTVKDTTNFLRWLADEIEKL